MQTPKKSLGQHWLTDEKTLKAICGAADLTARDTVLEIGPGLGNLTKYLVEQAGQVIAVEKDEVLASKLKEAPWKLTVVAEDIIKFNLGSLPNGYKVVGNIPYYLTGKLLKMLCESPNPPAAMTLLVQKEVAERICAGPGQMSILAVSVQLYYECVLGQVVPAREFAPPPKVDSQVVLLNRRPKPLFPNLDSSKFFQIARAGFSEKRKKLRSSLTGGLGNSKEQTDELLKKANINGDLRAQELSLEDWHKIYTEFIR